MPSLLFFLSPTNLLLSWTTLTVALPICAVSLTVTQILGLDSNDRRGKQKTLELELGVEGLNGTKKGALSGGKITGGGKMERRLSSTNSALIPVPEELDEEGEGDGEDGEEEGGFVTCEEEDEDENHEQDGDEEESENLTYQFVQSLSDEHENNDFQAQLQLGRQAHPPPSPRLFSSIDPSTLPSLLSEPMPFNFSSSSPDPPAGFEDSPTTTTTTSSPSVGTPGDGDHSPTIEAKSKSRSTKPKRPRPSSPDPRRTQTHPHSISHSTAAFASLPHHQQPIHGLPLHRNQSPIGMGGGTFESSQGTPLRGLGLGLEGGGMGGAERK